MSMLWTIHSEVLVRDCPVTVLRDVERDVERNADCHVLRNVRRNTIRLIRERRITRENMEPSILTARGQHPGTLA